MTTPEHNRRPGTSSSGNSLPRRPAGAGGVAAPQQRPDGRRTAARPNLPPPGRPDRIPLPFDNRRRNRDAGDWVYRHRVGLLVTVVLYLIAAILFVSYKIVVRENPTTTMYVDLVDPNEPEPPKPQEEEKPKPVERIDPGQYERVMNRRSNANAKMDASLKDDRGTKTEQLMEEAERVQQALAANRQAFRSGLDEVAEMNRRHQMPNSTSSGPKRLDAQQNGGGTTRVQGNVTVSYDLAGRTATYLHIPAYQCREGGTVVVGITVNRDGKVTNATVERASQGECIAQRAVQAALASSFNASASAPDRQRGTITYVFVAQ